MITWTQMKQQAADNCGLYIDSQEMVKINRDINNGVKLFQNAARRYWTRNERKTDLAANQQFYQFPSDMIRVSNVKAKSGGEYIPLKKIGSEDEWNRLNISQFVGTGYPTYYFIKGSDEIGIYPIPNDNVVDGLIVTFEPRMVDMAVDDFKVKVDVTENSVSVVAHAPDVFSHKVVNNCWFTILDGTDGNWYKVSKFIDTTHIELDNNYQGPNGTNVNCLIGQAPQFPEEYHDAPVNYACQQFFMLRKDLESASFYQQMYEKSYNEYRRVYGNKTTGGVINSSKQLDASILDPFAGKVIT